jgi:hypothetical protein
MTSRTAQRKKAAGPAKGHPKAKQRQRKRKQRRNGISPGLYAIGAVVAIIAVMVGYGVFNRAKTPDTPNATGTSAVIDDVTSVPASTLDAVGAEGVSVVPTALPPSTTAYTVDGKPAILYVGAEYCPYCAAERWALTIALSRFGSFDGLGLTTSSSTDIYPSTRTLSFHGSTFHSDLIAFDGVETATNELNAAGTSYAALDALTPRQQRLFQTYAASGSIPFLLIGNRYVQSGASLEPDVLQGKSWEEIAAALQDPTSDIAKEVLASANVITAAICELTGGEPANVCTSPGVQQAAAALSNA